MKKLLLLTPLIASALLDAGAQSKISMPGQLIIHQSQLAAGEQGLQNAEASETYSAYVNFNEGYDSSCLSVLDVEIQSDFGSIAVVAGNLLQLQAIAAMDEVRYVDFGEKMDIHLDYARPACSVNTAQSGFDFNGNTVSFDGTGVVAGMMDTGLEGGHVNFTDANGSTRIKRIWHFKSSNGSCTQYAGLTIRNFTTDTQSETHATHVAGILAGSYNRNGDFMSVATASGTAASSKTDQPIPYYGVATGADLAFSVGALYSPNITTGVQKIIEYAESEGQPVVVNLSLGSTIGPHDGSDDYSKTLGDLGKRGIICMSAGNDGDSPISLYKELTEADNTVKTMFVGNQAIGVVDAWTNDDAPVAFSWVVYNTSTKLMSTIVRITGPSGMQTVQAASNSALSNYFTGSLQVSSSVNPLNNRYNIYSNVNLSPKSASQGTMIALVIEGNAGQRVWIYGQTGTSISTQFTSNSVVGWDNGSAENTINNTCCAENIISVGSFNSRSTWGQFNTTGTYHYTGSGWTVNAISPFSSYGTSFQGRQLPDVVGPGAAIISSISRYYVSATNSSSTTTASAKNGSITDYWGVMQGTSMSCPFVAGTVAMWLQANPNLTYADVMEVIKESSTFNALQMRPAIRWGAGKIDAVKGLKYILENKPAAIGTVWDDDNLRFIVSATDGGYDVTLAGEAAFEVTVTDMQGRTVATAAGRDGAATVSTDGLQSGIYVISARGASACHSTKIAIR